jgi:hypothetical protein
MLNSKHSMAVGLAGILALGAASPSIAAPAVSNTVLSEAAAGDIINVRWGWRGGWRRGPGFGIGLGLALAGAALATAPYYGYAPSYAYAPAYEYAPAYTYAPVYAPAPIYFGWGWRSRREYAAGP